MKYLLIFSTLLFSMTALSNAPDCEFGVLTDPDGDGWGWEDGKSCRVGETPAIETEQPTDNSGCDYSNAEMNAGWGWNTATRESCPPEDSSSSGTGSGTDSPQDNGATTSPHDAMKALIVGGWDCKRRFPKYNLNELSQTQTGTEGGSTFGAITSWDTYAHLVCSHLNANCGRGSGSLFWHGWTLDFQPNGQLSIDLNAGDTFYWVGQTLHNWQLSEANAQLIITPEPAAPLWGEFSEVGFEWFNGERYMHLYPATADSPRLSCKARS